MTRFTAFAAGLIVCLPAVSPASTDDLIQANRNNDLTSIKAQLDKGADVNSADSHGSTLLMQAAAFGSADAVQLLLARGAEVNAKNQFEATALIWGANDPRKARLLIEKGADVNARSKRGRTPLMVAASCDGCAATVRLLLEKGADVKAKDQQGATALDTAVEADDIETIRLLIAKGADAAAADSSGFTPLMGAVTHCNLDAVRLILSKGADVNATNTSSGEVKFGKIQMIHLPALMWAAPGCSVDVMKTLLDAGAKVNEKDIRNMTPLMLAVASEKQDLAVIKLLLKAGADLNVKSNMGETALDWALKFGNPQVIGALRSAGAVKGDPFTPPQRKPIESRTPSVAIQSAMSVLQRGATEFFKQSGCVGCHHQPLATMAFASISGRASVDEAAAKEHIRMIQSRELRNAEPMLDRSISSGFADGHSYSLLSMAAVKTAATTDTDAGAVFVAGSQHRDGAWRVGGASRSPIQEGNIARTAIGVRVIREFAPPARKIEIDERVIRARNWLMKQTPSTNDDYAMRMLGLFWAGGESDAVRAAGRALIAQQQADGGWTPNPNLSSDAYATGQTLWALKESGALTASDQAYRRGVKYLLDTQWEDGSWYVRSRAVKLQPYFQGGFPFDHDQWISAAATAYGVMALAPAVERDTRAAR
jgi:ankyrin repeat protein